MLMARLADAAVAIVTGSVSTSAPGGITIDCEPPNVRSCKDAASMLLKPALVAMLAASMRRGSVPNSLVRRTRTALPAIEVCTISRRVDSTSVGIVCHGSPSKGEAAHVPTQNTEGDAGEDTCETEVDCAETVETAMSKLSDTTVKRKRIIRRKRIRKTY